MYILYHTAMNDMITTWTLYLTCIGSQCSTCINTHTSINLKCSLKINIEKDDIPTVIASIVTLGSLREQCT